jgi:hypothetical protein
MLPVITLGRDYDSRIQYLNYINPRYSEEIKEFLENHPEFNKVKDILSVTEYPMGYNRNHGEIFNPSRPNCLFEHLVYYIACTGVRYSYALKQWDIIRDYMRNRKEKYPNRILRNLTKKVEGIQPKKHTVYEVLNELLKNMEIFPNYDMTYENAVEIIGILKGVGKGCLNHLALFYGKSSDITPDITDTFFIKGFMKFYELQSKPTKKQLTELTKDWTNNKIGNMFMFQCAHYL